MKKNLIVLLISVISIFSISAASFNDKLSSDEINSLYSGNVVIRNIGSVKNICLASDNIGAAKLLNQINALKPNYLAEVIQIRNYHGNEDLPERLYYALMNISDYVGIPYYSEQGDAWYDLYSDAKIISLEKTDTITRVSADLTMEPFGLISTPMIIEQTSDYLFYSTTNSNRLRYQDKVNCVNPEKMRSCILLFREGDFWILYGVGGVDAAKIPFLTKRIETSFINRIKTFCNYIFEKI